MCARVAPGVSLTPISQSAAAGNSISYQITVTNNNNSGCGTSTFAFTPKLPSGWSSSHSPFTVSLDAGVSTSSTWTVTSPSTGVVEQSYAVFSTTYDTAATTASATAQANYIVTTPDSVPPTVKIVLPADGAAVKGVITISAQASDNIGVAKVELWVNGKLTNIDTSAPHSFKLNVEGRGDNYRACVRRGGQHDVHVDQALRHGPLIPDAAVSGTRRGGAKGR
jgi:Bacterial Ig domain